MNFRHASLAVAAVSLITIAGCRGRTTTTTAADGSTITLRHGNTPLHVAVSDGDFETARSLLDGGASADALNDRDETPLMTAANRGLTPIVDLMLAKHPNLALSNRYGKTALTFAVEQQSTAIVRRLVAAGASTTVVDYKGRGLDAYAKGNPAVLDALRGGSGQVTSPPPMVQQQMNAQQPTMPAMPAYPSTPAEPTPPMTPSALAPPPTTTMP